MTHLALRLGLLTYGAILFTGACAADPVSYSAPVGINLKAKADEAAKTGVVADSKNINTESGNPYGAFTNDARRVLGREPSRIEISAVSLLLGAGSKGVTALEQVVSGRFDVQIVMNDTNNTFNVAHGESPQGLGPLKLVVDFDGRSVVGEDYAKLVGGAFKLVVRSNAAPGFAGRKDTEADLQVTLEFAAYE